MESHANAPQRSSKGFGRRIARAAAVVVGVALAYYVTGRSLLVLGAPPNGAVTTVWLPSGITVAAFVSFGPWAALGSFLGSLGLDLRMGTPLPAGLLVAVANAGSEYLCYRLIGSGEWDVRRLDQSGVFRLVVAAAIASILSAVIGVTAYVAYGVVSSPLYLQTFLTWFGSTAVGIVLIVPFLACALDDWRALAREAATLGYWGAVLALACAAFLWQGPVLPHPAHESMFLIIILVLLGIAFRFPPACMPLAVFSFAIAAVAGAVLHVRLEAGTSRFVAIFALQVMLAGMAVVGYFLSSMVADLKRATEGLRLAAKVYDTTTEGIMVTSKEGNIIDANSACERITGYRLADTVGTHPSFLRSERHPPEFFKAQVQALKSTGEWQGEVWFRRANGDVFPAWLSLSPVRDARGAITEYVCIFSDITELREAQTKLVASARHAGMAEIATNMLHNVGNVLNSVNVSAGRLSAQVKHSKVHGLARAVGMIKEHAADLPQFLTHDQKGRLLPEYLEKLSVAVAAEQHGIEEEVERITRSIDHIKDIVATQQSYAGASTMVEVVHVRHLVEDALRINAESLTRHTVTVVRDYSEVPDLALDKARVMMILVNLIRNAKHAMSGVGDREPILTVGVRLGESEEGRTLRISVQDAGMGIPQENLTRIFAHGFTTKKDGHGFGLHSCALAAGEMGGTLTAHSDGPGTGATFVLEIPVRQ